jgi:hypothetical protein
MYVRTYLPTYVWFYLFRSVRYGQIAHLSDRYLSEQLAICQKVCVKIGVMENGQRNDIKCVRLVWMNITRI